MSLGTKPPMSAFKNVVHVILKERLLRQRTRLGLILSLGYVDLKGLFLLPGTSGYLERRLGT